MRSISRRGTGVVRASLLVALGCGVIAGIASLSGGQSGEQSFEAVTGTWVIPGMTYLGNASCSSSQCHGSDEAKLQSGQKIGNESTIWARGDKKGDPHALAWKTLKSAESKAIAAKLNIADAVTSEQCLTCHAMNIPAAQRGETFDIETGNSCETCHGPAERWRQPHAKAGWTSEQRAALGTAGLLKTHGLLDTTDIAQRATMCVSCHLQIDKSLVDAGHPELQFELYGYNNYLFKDAFSKHWSEPKWQMVMARQWAVGQAAALAASTRQAQAWKSGGGDSAAADALVAIYTSGLGIAKKHFGADTPDGLAKAQYTPEKCAAAAQELAALSAGATSATARKVIALGVMALAEASYDGRQEKSPDALWNALFAALDSDGGATYTDAVKKMASLAK